MSYLQGYTPIKTVPINKQGDHKIFPAFMSISLSAGICLSPYMVYIISVSLKPILKISF